LAEEWDGIRYDIETGAKIMEKRPINMTAKDAGRYAARIPDCLSDFPNSNCELNYASELGCKLDPTVKEVCQRNFRFEQAVFSGPRGLTLYPALSCVFEGEKGADLVVFKPKELARERTKAGADGYSMSGHVEGYTSPAAKRLRRECRNAFFARRAQGDHAVCPGRRRRCSN
jgi:hypothetical protein